MKPLNKTYFLVCSLLTMSNALFGYELFFSNLTEIPLIIASKKRAGIVEKYYQIVPPGGSVIQPWDDANCLESLQWTELNTKLPLQGGKLLADPKEGYQIPRNKQKLFDETFFNKTTGKGLYAWRPLPIVMLPNITYRETVDAAKKLVQGFEKPFCTIARDTVMEQLKTSLANAESALQNAINKKLPAMMQTTFKNVTLELKKKIEAYAKEKGMISTDKKECVGALAKTVEAAGKIAGVSICAHRQFAIYDTGEIDKLTRKPYLIATTGEGE